MKNKVWQIIVGISLMSIVIFFPFTSMVKAESGHTFNIELEPYTIEVKPEEEITINVTISNINMGENGINVLEGKINYDRTIFEEITTASIRNFDTWTTTYNDENSQANGKFLSASLSNNITQDSQIFSVSFRVKDNIKENKRTKIQFEDLTSNDGVDLIDIGTKSIVVDITIPNETDQNENGSLNNGDNNGSNKNGENTRKQKGIVDNSKMEQSMPYTGKSIIITIIILINVSIIVLLAIKNKKMKGIK